jgi:hypothetical protein
MPVAVRIVVMATVSADWHKPEIAVANALATCLRRTKARR